jgi:multidrug resistance efflux pump
MSRSSSLRARDAVPDGEAMPSPADRLPIEIETSAKREPETASPLADLDAVGRIAVLSEAFQPRVEPDAEAQPAVKAAAKFAKQIWAQHRRVLKTAIGLVVVVAAGWLPVRALLETTSTEAVINARLITLRAPIEGQIGPLGAIAVGTELQPGAVLVGIVNPRAERGRLDDLIRLIDQLEGENKVQIIRRDDLKALHDGLAVQTRAFQSGRIDQLEARVAELRSELAAAEARRVEAETALARTQALADSGTSSKVMLERAKRDATIAAEAQTALGHRLGGVEVELSALRKGVYIGDNYNDRPQSLQRADEIGLKLSEATADISHRQARLATLRAELAGEKDRFAERAAATLVAPVGGSIWEIMTAPGETVVRGQDLVRVLDCSGVVVTATVGETAYNQLRIGDAARFRFRGTSKDHEGRIVGLTGVATAPANLAIQPSALAKEPYRVTVAMPDLARAERCNVGRTGRVTFGK